MNKWMYAYLAIGLLLFAAPAGALVPDTITIETEPGWVTAGGPEPATLTVQVLNSTSGNTLFGGVAVNLAVDNTYGSISPACIETDANGTATAVFTPGTHSGTATITATVALNTSLNDSVDLHIDHTDPYAVANLSYNPEVTVGETTEITVKMVDRYGNVVDNRSMAEIVSFMVGSGSSTGGAAFVGGMDEITVPVDENGNATATLQVDTLAGENLVYIMSPVGINYITIFSVAGPPSTITPVVDPRDASVRADGEKTISLIYTLHDRYGNLAVGQGLWVNASVGQSDKQQSLLYSTRRGQVAITYGPENSACDVTITATAVAAPDVTDVTNLFFYDPGPAEMLLSASPLSMPSRDVNKDSVSEIRAKVMDIGGNPVEGEAVKFVIISNSSAPYNQTVDQKLEKGYATTDRDGYAVVKFYPGSFAPPGMRGWNASAKGTATVRATWENETLGRSATQNITLTWVNYPYLSVETSVSPQTVTVNDTVDVTIQLKGGGWKMEHEGLPIDVVFCLDRGEAMLLNDQGIDERDDRMIYAREAVADFTKDISSFGEANKVSLVLYGDKPTNATYPNGVINISALPNKYGWAKEVGDIANYPGNGKVWYNDYAEVRTPLASGNFPSINKTLYDIVPMKNSHDNTVAAPLRKGLYTSIGEIVQNSSSNRVKAIVVLMQNKNCYYGDPFARGDEEPDLTEFSQGQSVDKNYYRFDNCSSQNMSEWARQNNIIIYTIYYAWSTPGGADSEVYFVPKTLASQTGGKFFLTDDYVKLNEYLGYIAEDLKRHAGVDTKVDLNFEWVSVNDTTFRDSDEGNSHTYRGSDVFDYIHEEEVSTLIQSYNSTGGDIFPAYTRDDTGAWQTNQTLHFDIGTIELDQTWKATFRLKVKKDGNINIFGSNSTITFNNGTARLDIPDTFITAIPENSSVTTSRLLAVALSRPGSPAGQDAFYDTVPLTWTLTYNGTMDIAESLAYSKNNGPPWNVFWKKTLPYETIESADRVDDMSWVEDSTLMDVRGLSPGEYWIQVTASADDAPEAVDRTDAPIRIGNASAAYIKIA